MCILGATDIGTGYSLDTLPFLLPWCLILQPLPPPTYTPFSVYSTHTEKRAKPSYMVALCHSLCCSFIHLCALQHIKLDHPVQDALTHHSLPICYLCCKRFPSSPGDMVVVENLDTKSNFTLMICRFRVCYHMSMSTRCLVIFTAYQIKSNCSQPTIKLHVRIHFCHALIILSLKECKPFLRNLVVSLVQNLLTSFSSVINIVLPTESLQLQIFSIQMQIQKYFDSANSTFSKYMYVWDLKAKLQCS